MLQRDVAGMEIPARETFRRCLGVFQVAFHHRVATDHDLALGRAVHRDLGHGVGIHRRDVLGHGHQHTGTGLDRITLVLGLVVPIAVPQAFGHMAIGFGQAVNLRDVKSERLDLAQCRSRGRGTGGEYLDDMVELAPVGLIRVHDRIQNNGRAAEMGDLFIRDHVIDALGGHVAQADHRPAQHRHHPGVVPAVAMKERHNRQVARVAGHLPADRGPHGHEVSAPVVADDAFGPPGGAGRVVERDAFPFILGHDPGEIGVAGGKQLFVGLMVARGGKACGVVGHFDDDRRGAFHLVDGLERHG